MSVNDTRPLRLLVGSFAALIAAGTGLLLLPAATPADQPVSVVDALFTATSAVCVTGLVVRDTGTSFTPFGQALQTGRCRTVDLKHCRPILRRVTDPVDVGG